MYTFVLMERNNDYAILHNDQHNDCLKVHRNGLVERHPLYRLQRSSFIDATKWVEVKVNVGTKGYCNFTWHNKTIQYHVILAEAFVEKRGYDPDGNQWSENELLEVDHINHDRYDNSVDNLQWVSRRYNRVEGNAYRELHPEKYPNLKNCYKHKKSAKAIKT